MKTQEQELQNFKRLNKEKENLLKELSSNGKPPKIVKL